VFAPIDGSSQRQSCTGTAAVTRRDRARVVVAAGGLGTRVREWSAFLPKEFSPVGGQPAIARLLSEISVLVPARVVVVYHPYYEPFIRWARRVLDSGASARYHQAAGLPSPSTPRWEQLDLSFTRQRGRYADVTSVLNGAARLGRGDLYAAFADNLYPDANPMLALQASGPGDTVLARPYDRAEAPSRGVIITTEISGRRVMADLVEKPCHDAARELEERHGTDRLWLLEGRARLTQEFVSHLGRLRLPEGTEPKLSLALRGYSHHHPVSVLPTSSAVIDLGTTGAASVDPGHQAISAPKRDAQCQWRAVERLLPSDDRAG
jgi:UTP-glucose-1-phosphate uridylyltransferase